MKNIKFFFCGLTALGKIKQLLAKAVETWLGVTGPLGEDAFTRNTLFDC